MKIPEDHVEVSIPETVVDLYVWSRISNLIKVEAQLCFKSQNIIA